MNKTLKILFNLLSILSIILLISMTFARISSYSILKEAYPNDTLNAKFFLLKIFREISFWGLTILPIIFSTTKIIEFRNNQNILFFIIQNSILVMFFIVLYFICQAVQVVLFFIIFLIQLSSNLLALFYWNKQKIKH
ncbi:MAG: hypothetical protein IJF75_07325 [Clostridia bacterium]|nr:hypothetical protein [Clostridia bacterium]